MNTTALALAADELSNAIKPILAGKYPAIQGAALADLLAVWLAGHKIVGDPIATAELREGLLQDHCDCVRELVAAADLQERTPGL